MMEKKSTESYPHIPVALSRAHELLSPALTGSDPIMIDGTLGMGGHTESFLETYPSLSIIGIDRDADARKIAQQRTERFSARIRVVPSTYDRIPEVLRDLGIDQVDAILLDIGVSSYQLDTDFRGFSYSQDAPLDMRMDQEDSLTAEQILAEYPLAKLAAVFEKFGEEKLAMRYARAIVDRREERAITTTGDLVNILQDSTPMALKGAGHPAKRVFQALRIEVNNELSLLQQAIPNAVNALKVGGRIVVMSYQSLEDKIVKNVFQKLSTSSAPLGLPVELPEHMPELRLLTRGAEAASDEEIRQNPRSKPLRLRAAQRIREAS